MDKSKRPPTQFELKIYSTIAPVYKTFSELDTVCTYFTVAASDKELLTNHIIQYSCTGDSEIN